MKVKILSAAVYGQNLKVQLQFLDDASQPLGEREYFAPFVASMTVAQGKSWLKDKIAEFKAERDTDSRISAFVGNTYDESQL